jgi:hypothetical protein
MFRSVLKTALFAVALVGLASAANADVVVTLQLQEAEFSTEFIGSGTATTRFDGAFGTFSDVHVFGLSTAGCTQSCAGIDNPNPNLLLSSSVIINTPLSGGGGTLTFLATGT